LQRDEKWQKEMGLQKDIRVAQGARVAEGKVFSEGQRLRRKLGCQRELYIMAEEARVGMGNRKSVNLKKKQMEGKRRMHELHEETDGMGNEE
jgi:hypothetical protein